MWVCMCREVLGIGIPRAIACDICYMSYVSPIYQVNCLFIKVGLPMEITKTCLILCVYSLPRERVSRAVAEQQCGRIHIQIQTAR
jgi:hypothetical protein